MRKRRAASGRRLRGVVRALTAAQRMAVLAGRLSVEEANTQRSEQLSETEGETPPVPRSSRVAMSVTRVRSRRSPAAAAAAAAAAARRRPSALRRNVSTDVIPSNSPRPAAANAAREDNEVGFGPSGLDSITTLADVDHPAEDGSAPEDGADDDDFVEVVIVPSNARVEDAVLMSNTSAAMSAADGGAFFRETDLQVPVLLESEGTEEEEEEKEETEEDVVAAGATEAAAGVAVGPPSVVARAVVASARRRSSCATLNASEQEKLLRRLSRVAVAPGDGTASAISSSPQSDVLASDVGESAASETTTSVSFFSLDCVTTYFTNLIVI